MTFGEDRCKIRTATAPSTPAIMRSSAIGASRQFTFTNIADGTR
ncbi:hypothetical protein [Acrocarpospora macrocephala]|nr:hypothetical protein [Acrocarpospora macrocephala]